MERFSRYFAILPVVSALCCSCLKEEKDLFGESASARLSGALEEVRDLLTANQNGWRMEYYAGNSETDWGGHNYVLKFEGGEVVSWGETGDSTRTLFSLTADDGPVLAFDTYSSNIHYYSVPSSAYYQAKGGDFTFKLTDWSGEGIVMKGLRNSKKIRLYPLDEDAATYISKIRDASDNFIVSIIEGTVGNTEVTGDIDLNYRQLTLGWTDADSTACSVTVPFVTTLTGMHLYEPVDVAGETLEYLDFDAATGKFSTEAYGAETALTGRMPEDYVPYGDFAGTYTLNYWNNTGKATVTLTPGVEGETYIMSGLSKYYTLTLNYIKTAGRLSINSQKIGQTDDGSSVWFCAWNAYSGRLSWNTAAGVQTVWNLDSEHPVYTFESNNYDFLEGANSFLFWLVDADGYSAGQYTATGLDPYNRSMFPFLNNLTKN